MEIKWIEHQGKKVLVADYRGAKTENDLLATLAKAVEAQLASPEKVRFLSNIEGVFLTKAFMDGAKAAGKEHGDQVLLKFALVGVVGIKKILHNGYMTFTGQRNVRAFDNEQEALTWLTE